MLAQLPPAIFIPTAGKLVAAWEALTDLQELASIY